MFFIFLQQITEGFFVKSIASFDDTLTRIPIIAQLTQTREGRIAFSIGSLIALTLILSIALFLSVLLGLIPYRQYVIGALILFLSFAVYFEIFSKRTDRSLSNKLKGVSGKHFRKLIAVGFLVSFVTLLDDVIILTPLFAGDNLSRFLSITGVYAAGIVQILLVIYFGKRINQFKYKKELASAALVILAFLVFMGII